MSDLYDSKGDIYNKARDTRKTIEFYQKALDIAEEEYYFINDTRKKLKEAQERLNTKD